jgi:hypothetical protein
VWGSVLLAGLAGYGAANDLYMLVEPPSLNVSQLAPLPGFEAHPEVWREAMRAFYDTQQSVYASMQWSRGLFLFGLCMLTSIVFAEGLRLARVDGGREGARRRLAGALLGSAIFRTLEGAQEAAVDKRAGAAFEKVLAHTNEVPGGWPEGLAVTISSGWMIATSLVVGGGLLMLSMYFRSERVKHEVGALDAQTPPEE